MYESPINTFYQQVQSQIENGIYEAIQNVGISVDRDELIKALQYDRKRGYECQRKSITQCKRLPRC